AFVQVSLTEDHHMGSYEYMNRVRERIRAELPQLSAYFQSGGLVDAVLNMGLPAPIDVQVSGSKLDANYEVAGGFAGRVPAISRGQRRLYPARPRLPRAATRHRPRARQPTGADAERDRT